MVLFRPTPRVFHGWRCWLLRLFGAKIGRGVKIYASTRVWAPWLLTVEDRAIIGDHVDCYCVAPILIKQAAVISQGSSLCAATHDHRSRDFTLIPKPITIGREAWVAARAFVGPGVTVGDEAVVGACCVVFRDVKPGNVVIGNPSRVVAESRWKTNEA